MIDLHSHSTFSDGSNTPAELVEAAHNIGLTALALTDHDTVNGCKPLQEAAQKYPDLLAINGCEFNVDHPATVEIIAMNITDLEPYYEVQNVLIRKREEVCRARIEKLQKLGYRLEWENVAFDDKGNKRPTLAKPHIVNYLYATGQIKDKEMAYKELLGRGCPAYVDAKSPSAEETIDFIRQTGAVSILAHPCLIKLNEHDLYNEIKRLQKVGLQGMEVQHSDMSTDDMKKYQAWADELGLLKSGGSDYHGYNAHYGVELGVGRGQLNIPHEYIEKIIVASQNSK
ncbi:MAG: PHP domain-containing protein [Alphaproteobacteria bacterium]